ncbi:uncharacterized membrane protein YcaP (DUF421 family) [Sporomusaceae bacterium BoRhaA]|uniref:DUF421 domain-containing protein n=1 Tax=Pelorhabdus rhamnosifermentans TaxID=2772457 RepID=UPI001C062454|nr:YetF domain-containing protein [Pelorhabdus rhamnosifermentans]MBU2701558.1 uncharacterized membrane protein YcaP (DUF421 family) [Pelorhabdus rhamnosifermentans]
MFFYDEFGIYVIRIVILFTASLMVVRFMGNRAVGQLSPFDFVIMVGIGDLLITISMESGKNLLSGAEALVTLLALQQLLSHLALKNKVLRKWFEGTPVTLIQDGKILRENFTKTQFNYDDLRQELHKLGMDMTNLPQIRVARIESCGAFSLIKEPQCEPVTKQDIESYLTNIMENPFSPVGAKWKQIEQLAKDVPVLIELIKQQRPSADALSTNEKQLHS